MTRTLTRRGRAAAVAVVAFATLASWSTVAAAPSAQAAGETLVAPTASGPAPAAARKKTPVDPTFSIAVLPDTQQEVLRDHDGRFGERSAWLVANRSKLDLRFVTHTGDVVNWDTPDHSQYVRAAAAVAPLQAAGIPYSLSVGNHDTAAVCPGGGACNTHATRAAVRDTSTFNRYLNDQRLDLAGAFETGKVDNTYHRFDAGGRTWLVLNLELWPRAGALAWAQQVVAGHPHDNVIVVTHSYLTGHAHVYGGSDYGDTSPKVLQAKLIKKYANIRMVFCGHVGKAGHRKDKGVHGNRIDSFLLAMHSTTTNPLRLVSINTRTGTLKTWVYAPWTKHTYSQYTVKLKKLHWVQ